MKNKSKIIIIIILVVVVAAGAYFWMGSSSESVITAETTPVTKGEVTKMVTATGTIEPLTEVEVGTQVSGKVAKLYADYNSVVKKGDLLAEIDKTNLLASLSQAKATYNSAVTERDYLQVIFDRQKSLYENKVISKADYDEALYNLKTAKNTVTQRYSDLQEAQTNLSYAEIYSPIDGIVLSREVDEGQTVAASYETPTLFTIAKDLKQMQVEADVDEADIGEVQEGQRVTFTVDAYQGTTFEGVVTQVRLDYTEDSNVITYTVVIKAENPDLKLKPGLTATVYIYTLELQDQLTIQAKAANFQPDAGLVQAYEQQQGIESPQPLQIPEVSENESVVYKLQNNKITAQKVVLGESDGVNIQVKSGLNEGDKLVYNLEETKGEVASSGSNESPFMPKPPGKDKDKDKKE
ncbi:HlyD family secretion protein [Pustulibacterium marinum]|uniref:HlyD family secretion protein n=1 Tax=Pustulibacterium marinum TaxID=1224947 RepID=A0A1I7FRW3_9FLAO|nr:efflux RND transporter periplasmic adaptor subunit [Pustulibacterium marinum]SFU38881.1 HlyD family secretion protein [Pustulibacterium marinum]